MESEKESARLEILKIRKGDAIFGLCIIPLSLAFVVSGIIAAVNIGSKVQTSFYVFLVLAGIFFTILLIAAPFEIKRNKRMKVLIDKFAGPISDSDKALAKTFEVKWESFHPDIKRWKFDFLWDQDYENFAETISNMIGGIGLGVKGEKGSFIEIVYKDFRELQGKSELDDKTKEIIGVLFEILSLMEKNSYSLKPEHNEISTKKD